MITLISWFNKLLHSLKIPPIYLLRNSSTGWQMKANLKDHQQTEPACREQLQL